jgi:two-component system, NtrC family, response regulator AtoC
VILSDSGVNMLVRVLIAARDPVLRQRLGGMLAGEGGVEVRATPALPQPSELSRLGEAHPCELLVIDRAALGDPPSPGMSALRDLSERPDVVVVQERDCAVERSELLIAGARDVIPRMLPDALLQSVLTEHLRRVRRSAELRLERRLHRSRAGPTELEAIGPGMRAVLDEGHQAARGSSSILILGESGVGKEWVAQNIHAASPRRHRPFVPVHCAALPEGLIESELFGHEKGAFTGATRMRRGHFEMAHGGTLFLDEVGDIPLGAQAKLLRVLQDRRVQRVGAETALAVDVRIIAATHRDLRQARSEGSFRDDLWYRLAVVAIEVPPLRHRPEDIPGLVAYFLAQHARALGREAPELHPEAARALERHSWPGNVRELMNVLERAVLFCPAGEILVEHLVLEPRQHVGDTSARSSRSDAASAPVAAVEQALSLARAGAPAPTLEQLRRGVLEDAERGYIEGLLHLTRGSIQETARGAGVPVRTLFDLLRRHGIDKDRYRESKGRKTERLKEKGGTNPDDDVGVN